MTRKRSIAFNNDECCKILYCEQRGESLLECCYDHRNLFNMDIATPKKGCFPTAFGGAAEVSVQDISVQDASVRGHFGTETFRFGMRYVSVQAVSVRDISIGHL